MIATSVCQWTASHRLKINDSKTEILVISRKRLDLDISINVGDTTPEISKSAKNIGVVFDSKMSLELHVSNICRKCYIQLRNLRKLRPYLSKSALIRLVHCFISSQLDYCNSLLIGLPAYLISKLQKIQNSAARIICGVSRGTHMTPILAELHWLPVEKRIIFKIVVITFKCLHGIGPVYLSELLVRYEPSRSLRSAQQTTLVVPFTRSALASERSFSVAAPRLWNSLPEHLRAIETLSAFKSALKTELFN